MCCDVCDAVCEVGETGERCRPIPSNSTELWGEREASETLEGESEWEKERARTGERTGGGRSPRLAAGEAASASIWITFSGVRVMAPKVKNSSQVT